jgi:carboxyl-terminal processing protease
MNARVWLWLLLALLLARTAAQEACPEPVPPRQPMPETPMVMPEGFRVALFDGVGQAVSELYLFEDFGGVDWEAVLDEFAPYVLQTENAWEVYELLDEMVALLLDPFTTFLSPLELEALAAQEATYGGIGALLDRSYALREGEGLRIVYVFPESPAQEAGLKSRDRILAVEEDFCPQVERIRGPTGSKVRLLVSSPGGEPRELVIERRTIEPRIVPEVRRLELEPTVGYLRLVTLSGQETLELIEAGLKQLLEEGLLSGLVIDVRGTRLGAPGVLINMLGNFVSGEVGAFYARVGETPLEVRPSEIKAALDEVPLVVLIDDASEGEAEQLAAVLQHQGRAQVVGRPTAGRARGVRPFDFPDGSRLQLTVLGFMLPDGTKLERRGVVPDVAVEADWADYPEASDPYLLEALRLLVASRQNEGEE